MSCSCEVDFVNKTLPYLEQKVSIALQPFTLSGGNSQDVPSSSGSGGKSSSSNKGLNKVKVLKLTVEEVSTASLTNSTSLMRDLMQASGFVASASYCDKCYQQILEQDLSDTASQGYFGGLVNSGSNTGSGTSSLNKANSNKTTSHTNKSTPLLQKVKGFAMFMKHLHAIDGFALCSVITSNASPSPTKASPNAAASSSSTTSKTAKRLKPTLLRQGILLPMGANRAVIYLEDDSKPSYTHLWKKYYCEPKRDKRNVFIRPEARSNVAVISELENSNSMMAFERNAGSGGSSKLSRGLAALNKVGPVSGGTALSRSRSARRESLEMVKESLLSDEKSNHEKTLNEMFYSDDSDIQSIGSYPMLRTQSRMSNTSEMSEDVGDLATTGHSEHNAPMAADLDNGIAMLSNEHSNLSISSDKSAHVHSHNKSTGFVPQSSPAMTEDGSNLFPALREDHSRFSQQYSPLHDDSPMDYSSFNKEDTLNFYVSASGFGDDDEESKMYIDGNNYIIMPTSSSANNLNNHGSTNRSPTPISTGNFLQNAGMDDSAVRMVDAPNAIKVTGSQPTVDISQDHAEKPLGLFGAVLGGASTGLSSLFSFFKTTTPPSSQPSQGVEMEGPEVHTELSEVVEEHPEAHRQSLLASLIESTNSSAEHSKVGQPEKRTLATEEFYDVNVDDDDFDNRTESTLAEQDYLLDIQQSLAMDNLLLQQQQSHKSGTDKKRTTSMSSVESADSANNNNPTNPTGSNTRNKSTPSPIPANTAPSSNSNTPMTQQVYQAGKDKVAHWLTIIQEQLGESSSLYLPLEQLLAGFESSPYVLSKSIVDTLLLLPDKKKAKAAAGKKKSASGSSAIEAALAQRKKTIAKFLQCMKLLLKQKIGSDRHTAKAFCCIAMVTIFVTIELHLENRSLVKMKELDSQLVNAMMRLNLALGSPAIPSADMSYLFNFGPTPIASSAGISAGSGARIEYMVSMLKKLYADKSLWAEVLVTIVDEYDYAKKVDNPSPIKVAPISNVGSNVGNVPVTSSNPLDDILSTDPPAVDPPAYATGNNNASFLMPPPPPVNMQQHDAAAMPEYSVSGLKRSSSTSSINASGVPTGISRQNSLISERKPILGHRLSMSKSRAITVNPLLSAYNMKIARPNPTAALPTFLSSKTNTSTNNINTLLNNKPNPAQAKAVIDRFRRNFPENSKASITANQHSPLSPSPKKPRRSFTDHDLSSPLPSTPMRLDPTYSQVDVVESTPMDVYSRYSGHASASRGSVRKSAGASVHDIFAAPSSARKTNNHLASPSKSVGRGFLDYHDDDDDHFLGPVQHEDDGPNDFEVLRKNTRGMRTASAAAAQPSSSSLQTMSPAFDITATSTPVRSRKKRDLSEILDIGNSVIHHDLNTGDSSDVTDVASYQNSAQSTSMASSVDTEGPRSIASSVDVKRTLRRSSRTKSLHSDADSNIDNSNNGAEATHKSPINSAGGLFE